MNFKVFIPILVLMGISLAVISSMTAAESESETFFNPWVRSQIQWFFIGWACFFFFAGLDYRKLREWSWGLYLLMVILLVGLFFVSSIQNVHRWYRIPGVGLTVQPSEYAKLIVVLMMGYFLERKGQRVGTYSSSIQIALLVGIPFILILKQPDLGTAFVLYPITLVMCYLGGVRSIVIKVMTGVGILLLVIVSLLFLDLLNHEQMRPVFTSVLKEYQYERLNPHTYHQKAAQSAIAIGGMFGTGWRQGEFSARKWLPAAHTDSVFAAYGEEFGWVGVFFLLSTFYALIYFCFQVTAEAKDHYGRLLSAGLTVYLAVHILINMAMMCGFLPITGVPLILVTYGGNSVLTTMAAVGILQSIYSRRFMF